MEEKAIQEVVVPTKKRVTLAEGALSSKSSRPAFEGLNLAELAKALIIPYASQSGRVAKTAEAPVVEGPVVGSAREGRVHAFPGLDLADMIATLNVSVPTERDSKVSSGELRPARKPAPDVSEGGIATADVVASLLTLKKSKRVKVGSLKTYEKRLNHFQRRFPCLPMTADSIIKYLDQFDGDTGRHRRNIQDLLVMLYDHAVKRFGLPRSPMMELERAIVNSKPIRPLSLDQTRLLFQTSRDDVMEAAAVDLLAGHGWRQIEVRRVLAEHVNAMSDGVMEVDGKERRELTPIMPETQQRLRYLAKDLKPGEHVFRSRRKRGGSTQPLGEKGMASLVQRQFVRAGIDGATGHDLRRTFASLVRRAGADEFLTMRLLRDIIPGSGKRYFGVSAQELLVDLMKFSPITLVKAKPERQPEADGNVLPVQRNKDVRQTASAEACIDEMVEAGESRTPRPREAAQDILQA